MKEIFSGEAVSIKPSGTFINILGKTTAEFESGEVAYLLGEAWGQNIDNGETKQSLPEFSDARVYQNRVYSSVINLIRPLFPTATHRLRTLFLLTPL